MTACKLQLMNRGLPYPRTCSECGLGACRHLHEKEPGEEGPTIEKRLEAVESVLKTMLIIMGSSYTNPIPQQQIRMLLDELAGIENDSSGV